MRVLKNHLVVEKFIVEDYLGKLTGPFKEATHKSRDIIAIPHTLSNVRSLKEVGVLAPSPVTTQYEWPGLLTPTPQQVDTVDMMTTNDRMFVNNSMGTGKTISSLWAADYLMRQGVIKRCLIVAPLSTLKFTWSRAIFDNFLNRSFVVLDGARARRVKNLRDEYDFYIVNPEGLHILVDELALRHDINHVIVDELAMFRKAKERRLNLNSILNGKINRTAWGMTGEPTPDAPTDAYWQIRLIRPSAQASMGGYGRFRDDTMYRISEWKWVPRETAMNHVFRFMQPSVRYSLEDCATLPPILYQYRGVDMMPEQEEHYKKLMQESKTVVEGNIVTAVNAGVLLTKLVQVSCGAVYDKDGNPSYINSFKRLSVLKEVIDEASKKVIVFAPYTAVLRMIEGFLVKTYGRSSIAYIDGTVSKEKRFEIMKSFQEQKTLKVLVAHPKPISHGVTLTAADTNLWYAPITSNDVYSQANGRIYRISQDSKTNVINLFASKAEEKIYKGLASKKENQDILLELIREYTHG